MRTIAEQRASVIDEAMSWRGTPYIPSGRIKGVNGGCDCLTFLVGVFENAGIIPEGQPLPVYAHDWHLHNHTEYYLLGKDDMPGVLHFCREVDGSEMKPGDVVLWKFGLDYSHAAIVVDWPQIIHAFSRRPVGVDDALRKTVLLKIHEVIALRNTPRPRRYFRVKDWN
jgi:cell wall-associated NlpC family hydrolase